MTIGMVNDLVQYKTNNAIHTMKEEMATVLQAMRAENAQLKKDVEHLKSEMINASKQESRSEGDKIAKEVQKCLTEGQFTFVSGSFNFDRMFDPQTEIAHDPHQEPSRFTSTPEYNSAPGLQPGFISTRQCTDAENPSTVSPEEESTNTPTTSALSRVRVISRVRYNWKKSNPDGEIFLIRFCIRTGFVRALDKKQEAFKEGISKKLWNDNDAWFARVTQKIDNICRKKQRDGAN